MTWHIDCPVSPRVFFPTSLRGGGGAGRRREAAVLAAEEAAGVSKADPGAAAGLELTTWCMKTLDCWCCRRWSRCSPGCGRRGGSAGVAVEAGQGGRQSAAQRKPPPQQQRQRRRSFCIGCVKALLLPRGSPGRAKLVALLVAIRPLGTTADTPASRAELRWVGCRQSVVGSVRSCHGPSCRPTRGCGRTQVPTRPTGAPACLPGVLTAWH